MLDIHIEKNENIKNIEKNWIFLKISQYFPTLILWGLSLPVDCIITIRIYL